MKKYSKYVVCLDNKKFKASLEAYKIYRAIKDADATRMGLIRIVDESGEDYLYPDNLFLAIEPPQAVRSSIEASL